jgi:hypothetical protein
MSSDDAKTNRESDGEEEGILDDDALSGILNLIASEAAKRAPKDPRGSAWGKYHRSLRRLSLALANAEFAATELLKHARYKRDQVEATLAAITTLSAREEFQPEEPKPIAGGFEELLVRSDEATREIMKDIESPKAQKRLIAELARMEEEEKRAVAEDADGERHP